MKINEETSVNHYCELRERNSILISDFKFQYKKRAAFIYGLINAIILGVKFFTLDQYFISNFTEWKFISQVIHLVLNTQFFRFSMF